MRAQIFADATRPSACPSSVGPAHSLHRPLVRVEPPSNALLSPFAPRYNKVIDVPNSMTVLRELLPLALAMSAAKELGSAAPHTYESHPSRVRACMPISHPKGPPTTGWAGRAGCLPISSYASESHLIYAPELQQVSPALFSFALVGVTADSLIRKPCLRAGG